MTEEERQQRKIWFWIIFVLAMLVILYGWYRINWITWRDGFNGVIEIQEQGEELMEEFGEIEDEATEQMIELRDQAIETAQPTEEISEENVDEVIEILKENIEEQYAEEESNQEEAGEENGQEEN